MKRNFVSQLNNINKISHTLCVQIEGFEYKWKVVLGIYVSPASTVIRCVSRVYDGNDEDQKIDRK